MSFLQCWLVVSGSLVGIFEPFLMGMLFGVDTGMGKEAGAGVRAAVEDVGKGTGIGAHLAVGIGVEL